MFKRSVDKEKILILPKISKEKCEDMGGIPYEENGVQKCLLKNKPDKMGYKVVPDAEVEVINFEE